jgi:hypothetical protein
MSSCLGDFDAMSYHMKQFEDESKVLTNKRFVAEQTQRKQETPQEVGRLLLLYVDEAVADPTPFGDVRQDAFKIMPREALQLAGQRLSAKPASKLAMRWQVVDGLAERIRRQLRPLYGALDFSSGTPDNPWLAALAWMRSVFARPQRLSQRPLAECPDATLPNPLRPYLLTFDANGKPAGVHKLLRAGVVLRCRRRRPLHERRMPVPVGADTAAAALRQAGRRRGQRDGGDYRPGDEPRQLRHGHIQRLPAALGNEYNVVFALPLGVI